MFTHAIALVALSRRENPTVFQKTLTVNDFICAPPDYGFPLGNLQMIGKSKADVPRGRAEVCGRFGRSTRCAHAVDFWLMVRIVPLPQNRVTLNFKTKFSCTTIHQPGTDQPAAETIAVHCWNISICIRIFHPNNCIWKTYSHRRRRSSIRHLPLGTNPRLPCST